MDFSFLAEYYQFFLSGMGYTIGISAVAVILGFVSGTLMAMMRLSKWSILRGLSSAYVEIVRGTPLLLQLFLVYYGIEGIPMVVAAIVAMTINSTAYISEIIRAGILAVDQGQMEAARSLGLSQGEAMKLVILPQAYKNILPAMGNEFITLIKESAIVSVIGVHDLMYNADTVRGITYKPFEPLIVATLIYFCLTFTLSKVLKKIEGRMSLCD